MKTAIQAQSEALKDILIAQEMCLDASGLYVLPQFRYRYQLLVRKALAFKESIDWMNALYKGEL